MARRRKGRGSASARPRQLTRMLFPKLYPGLAGKETYVNLDIGLIRVDNLNEWTASVYGVGTMGPIADLGLDNLSLRLIDCPVRAYGCGSGHMRGAIKALFYRYKSLGGFEDVSDFLIGGREKGQDLSTHPGDSGNGVAAGDPGRVATRLRSNGAVRCFQPTGAASNRATRWPRA